VRIAVLPNAPLQLRMSLALVDRGIERVQKVILARDPATPPEHVILRALSYALFFEEGLRVADGPPRRDRPDLAVVDLEDKTRTFIACGAADAEEIRRMVVHQRGVTVRALFDDPAACAHFVGQIEAIKKRPPGFDDMEIWSLEHELVARLAARDELRQRWAVTLVADHLYVDSDGTRADSALTRTPVPAFVP
jgi:uncharacterized protein YaeQ